MNLMMKRIFFFGKKEDGARQFFFSFKLGKRLPPLEFFEKTESNDAC